jgi:hypothetical protein
LCTRQIQGRIEVWKWEREWIARGTIRICKKDILRKAEYKKIKKVRKLIAGPNGRAV